MVRIAVVALFVLVAAVVAAWRFEVLPNPFAREPAPPPVPALLTALSTDDEAGVRAALAAGSDLAVLDAEGRPPLHVAAMRGLTGAAAALIEAGADVQWAAADGSTALLLALRHAPDARLPLLLLNAGADPTVVDAQGQGAMEHVNANPGVRNSGLTPRLRELVERPFVRGWPSGYVAPVPDATISSRAAHWPNAPRSYRNGTHEGFDFYGGAISGTATISYGTPIVAVADGVVLRADHEYQELDVAGYEAIIAEARRVLSTPPEILDQLRGRQVWVEHAGGFVSRYAHLSDVPDDVRVGATVVQGQVVGLTGNSGTIEAAQNTRDDPHPHVEIWNGAMYLGQGLEPAEIFSLAGQVFGQRALPPRWVP
jgi:murein DD-endopeptidase MepM/ murein hydrolase activator NlpD